MKSRAERTGIEFDRMATSGLISVTGCVQNTLTPAIKRQEVIAFLATARSGAIECCNGQQEKYLIQPVMPDEADLTACLVIGAGRIGKGQGQDLALPEVRLARARTAASAQSLTAEIKGPIFREPFW